MRDAQQATWRSKLIKAAVVVIQSTRRIAVYLVAQWPFWPLYHAAGCRAMLMPAGP